MLCVTNREIWRMKVVVLENESLETNPIQSNKYLKKKIVRNELPKFNSNLTEVHINRSFEKICNWTNMMCQTEKIGG